MKPDWIKMIWLSSLTILFSQLGAAQVCRVMNSSLNGPYGYVAMASGTTPAASTTTTGTGTTATGTTGTGTTATGTTGTTGTGTGTTTYSNSTVGTLLGDIAGTNQFATSGVLFFDGAGNIVATQSPTATTRVLVGSYNVNADCSITISLGDAFNTNASTNTTTTSLAGIILDHGQEIDLTTTANLTSTSSTSGTTGTGTTGTTTSGTSLAIRLTRLLYRNGCSDANLNGLYGFVLNPVALTVQTSSTTAGGSTNANAFTTSAEPSTILGSLYFDGTGQILALPSTTNTSATSTPSTGTAASTQPTSFSALQYSGTYTVNPDCSGSMTISNNSSGSTTTGSTTGTTGSTGTTGTTGKTGSGASSSNASMTIYFLVTPVTVPSQAGLSNFGQEAQQPGLTLGFSNSNEAGWGYAQPD